MSTPQDKYISELQNVNPSSIIELFELELTTKLHGSELAGTSYFHSGSSLNFNGEIKFDIFDYEQFFRVFSIPKKNFLD